MTHQNSIQVQGFSVMYQSNRSFDIPLGNPPGICVFEKFLFKSPLPGPKKLFRCSHLDVPLRKERVLISRTAAGNRG